MFHKRITFLIGPKVSEHFFKAKDTEMSQKEVYEFNVPTFGKGVVFDVDHTTRAEQRLELKGRHGGRIDIDLDDLFPPLDA